MASKKTNTEKKNNKNKEKSSKEEDGAQNSTVLPHSNSNNNGGKIITDSRFASVHSDPRFQNVPKQKSKVAIDSRFHHMFSDKSFASSAVAFDKRGKPKEKSENSLQHYYQLEEEEGKDEEKSEGMESDGDDEEQSEKDRGLKKLGGEWSVSELDGESERSGSEDDVESGGSEYTTGTEEEEGGDDVYFEEDEGEQFVVEENVPVIDKETRRLAVVNMDWRHVRAVDLYMALSAFLPKSSGKIVSVAVYPSEFGLKRMEEEALHGPKDLFDDDKGQDDEDDDDEIDNEKLRAYEKSKLRYYYAVVECDSIATADHLYNACDGAELERSSNELDLRFIPDSMEFKHPPRDVATEAPSDYEGLDFFTRELQHSRVNLTWDEDEPHRVRMMKRKFNADQLADVEFKEFLASDKSESDDSEDSEDGDPIEVQSDKKHKKRDRYRALLQSGDGSDEDGEEGGRDMEVTFNSGLENINKRILEKKDKKSETVWEAYLRKRSEKKKARKNKAKHLSDDESSDTGEEAVEEPDDFFVEEPSAKRVKKEALGKNDRKGKDKQEMDKEAEASRAELELLLADDKGANTNLKGYNLKLKKAKGKKGKHVPDEDKIPTTDYDDPRFSALFASHLFALDPTDPQFKRSAAYVRQLAQRQNGEGEDFVEEVKKRPTESRLPSDSPRMNKNEKLKPEVSSSKDDKHEISALIKSIKMKSKQIKSPSNAEGLKKENKLLSGLVEDVEGKNELSALVRSIKKKTAKVPQK